MNGGQLSAERPRYFAFLPAYLFRPEAPLAYILKTWLLVLLPSLLLSVLVNSAAPSVEGPDISVDTPRMIAALVIGAPIIETIIMIVPLLILNKLFGLGPAAIVSAIGWGIAHSTAAPVWGLVVWWPFLIFSIAFLEWNRRSLFAAFLIVAAVHAMQNGFGALLLVAAGRAGAAS